MLPHTCLLCYAEAWSIHGHHTPHMTELLDTTCGAGDATCAQFACALLQCKMNMLHDDDDDEVVTEYTASLRMDQVDLVHRVHKADVPDVVFLIHIHIAPV